MMLLRNGVTDPDSTDPAEIGAAKDAILQMINDNGARLAINGTYVKLSEGEVTISQSWSGDIVGAKYYLPKDTSVRRARVLVPRGQEGADRQRHDRDPRERARIRGSRTSS